MFFLVWVSGTLYVLVHVFWGVIGLHLGVSFVVLGLCFFVVLCVCVQGLGRRASQGLGCRVAGSERNQNAPKPTKSVLQF